MCDASPTAHAKLAFLKECASRWLRASWAWGAELFLSPHGDHHQDIGKDSASY